MSLPPELVIMVLHHLRDDKAALAQCSLVCRTWVGHAYQHIFRVLTIHKPAAGLKKAVSTLLLHLRSAPHLGSYVQELTLAANELAPGSHRTLYVPDLLLLLMYFDRLRVLEISHAHLDSPRPLPLRIPSMTHRKLSKLVLTSLASAGSFALARVVGHFTDIEELCINDFPDSPLNLAFFGMGLPGQATSLPSFAQTRVQSFTVKHCGRLIGPTSMLILSAAFHIPALKTLSLQLHDVGCIAALNDTIHATGLSLSHLDLNLLRLPLSYDPHRLQSDFAIPALSTTCSLQSIHFTMMVWAHDGYTTRNRAVWRSFVKLLFDVAANVRDVRIILHTAELRTAAVAPTSENAALHHLSLFDWSHLDNAAFHCPLLNSISIGVINGDCHGDSFAPQTSWLQEEMGDFLDTRISKRSRSIFRIC